MTEEETFLLERFEIDGELADPVDRDDPAEGAADLHGLDRIPEAACHHEDVLERRAHGDFVDAGPDKVRIEREQLRSRRLRRADRGVALASAREDGVEVREGLDVVDDGRLAEESLDRGERRARPHLGPLALDAREQCGFLAADVGPRALDRLEMKIEAGAADVFPEQSGAVEIGDGLVDPRERIGILGADVEHTRVRPGIPARHHHAEEDAVGALLHQVFVNVGPGIAFVGVADDVFHRPLGSTASGPLEAEGEAGPAAPSQAALLQLDGEGVAIAALDERDEGRVIFVDPRKGRGEDGRPARRDDLVAVHRVAFAGDEERFQGRVGLARVVFALVLEGPALMAAAEATDMPDLRLGEMRGGAVVEFVLRAGAEAG